MTEPADLPARESDNGGSSATQLSILLASATSMIDEEFKRSERLDAKSRNQIALVGAFFAVVQAGVIGLINGSLGSTERHDASSFVPWLAIAGGVAAAALVGALALSYRAWKLHDDPALSPETIDAYKEHARQGNPAVGVKLIGAYTEIAEGRRANNERRAKSLESAAIACAVAMTFIAIELVLAFVAVGVQ
jgi:hypothetical protein